MAEQPAPSGKKWVAEPDMEALLDLFKLDVMQSVNSVGVGVVEAFDEDNQLAQVSLAYKRIVKGAAVDYPVLVDCPVFVLSGGAAQITFPVAVGDECLVLFNDRNMDNWYSSGTTQPVATNRIHALTDAIALVGLRSQRRLIQAYDMLHALLAWGDVQVGVSETKVLVRNGTGTLNDRLQDIITQVTNINTALQTLTAAMSAATPVTVVAAIAVPSATAAATLGVIAGQLPALATQIGDLLE